jgi:hypothetical protein
VAFTRAAAAGIAEGASNDRKAAGRWRELYSFVESLRQQL